MKNLKTKLIPVLGTISSVLLFAGCQGSGDGEESLGKLMSDASMNTLMGVVVVFAVLVLISLLISCFSLINKAEKAFNAKKAAKAEKEAPPAPAPAPAEEAAEEETDDLELIAVITAAIAAQEGTSPDGLVVRSIRKVSTANKWKRG